MNNCLSCDLKKGKVDSIGGLIDASEHFEARQDYEVPIAGFVIIYSKKHIQIFEDFNDSEKNDFFDFLCKLRKLMRTKLNIQKIYMIHEEDSQHFHFWLFPRYEWMDKFGKKIKSVKPIMNWAEQNLFEPENVTIVKEAVLKLKS